MTRRVASLALASAVLLAAPAVAAAPKKVNRFGVGKVKLGATHKGLKAKGLVGKQVPGCELGGPGAKAARLKAGVKGAVQLSKSKPRRVRSIVITKGGAAKGVGIGARKADIKAKFPHAKFDTSTEDVFALTLVTVPKRDGGRFQFGIDTDTKKVSVMGVPFIAFCE